jgi:hypothetical protein
LKGFVYQTLKNTVVNHKIGLIAFIFISLSACTRSPAADANRQQGSQLSEISIKIPEASDYPNHFGTDCIDLKLKEEVLTRLGTADKCQAINLLLSSFRLTISENIGTCDSGASASSIQKSGKFSGASIADKVRRGCGYDLLLEVGEEENSTLAAYFSNADSAKGALTKEALQQDRVAVIVTLLPTESGLTIGFPKMDSGITTPGGDAAQVDISVTIGNRSAASNGTSTSDSATSVSPTPSARDSSSNGNASSNDPIIVGGGTSPGSTASSNPTATSSAVAVPKQSSEIAGTYKSDCRPVPYAAGQYEYLSMTFISSEIKGKRILTNDEKCEEAAKKILEVEAQATFIAFPRPRAAAGEFNFNVKVQSQKYTLFNEAAAAAWTTAKACGVNRWVVNQSIDTIANQSSEEACTKDFLSIIRSYDILRFSTHKVEMGLKIFAGPEDMNYILGFTEDSRPSQYGKSLSKKE